MLYPDIGKELIKMSQRDQEMRNRAMKDMEAWDKSVDIENTIRLQEIIDEIGWPTISKVGKEASRMAWLIAQHADHDSIFQHRVLEIMKSVEAGEIEKSELAYLEDRVRVNEGKAQRFGTQFFCDKDGVFGPRLIEDRNGLENRRKEFRLEPFAEYEKKMREKYRDV
ncbi:hypothetical protein HYV73_03785 [Candidatus Uhrbacteria bacterium]|nr:hypothetical protein [Candidatus Uhrbacteria bacterium]